MKKLFILNSAISRDNCIRAIDMAPNDYCVEIKPKSRTLEQNSLLWPLLALVSKNVVWHGLRLSAESWKNIFTSSLKKQTSVPNLEGSGFVVLGASTSSMTKQEMADLIELIYAFLASQDIQVPPSKSPYAEW